MQAAENNIISQQLMEYVKDHFGDLDTLSKMLICIKLLKEHLQDLRLTPEESRALANNQSYIFEQLLDIMASISTDKNKPQD